MEDNIQRISEEIQKIQERNARVEADKAWEGSATRIGFIALITYLLAAFLLYVIGVESYVLSALVPMVGFVLSVQTLPLVKRWWIKKYRGL